MGKPLANWDQANQTPAGVVWWSKLDNRYQIEVQRTDDATGTFFVFDHEDSDKELLSETVVMQFNAIFGPDAEDVGRWMDMGAEFVDSLAKK